MYASYYYSFKEPTRMINVDKLFGTLDICGLCAGNIKHSKCCRKQSYIFPYMGCTLP